MSRRRFLPLIAFIAAVAAFPLLIVFGYAILVAATELQDWRVALQEPFPQRGDYSRLTTSTPRETIAPSSDHAIAIRQLQDLLHRAVAEKVHVSVAGSAHSMGGHTLAAGAWRVEMRTPAFQHIGIVQVKNGAATVRVGAGVTWHQLLRALDRSGWSVATMQSNDDFTVGGSVSVNCHGWQPDATPLMQTVAGFTLLRADGSIVECRADRPSDAELFRAVGGGYGLLGIILEVELRLVPNAFYRAAEFATDSTHYAARFEALVAAHKPALAYGRLSVAPGDWFLRDARIIAFGKIPSSAPAGPANTILENGGHYGLTTMEIAAARAVFRASVGSSFGKLGRWTIERWHGQTHRILSRNGILQTPSTWFANRDPRFTEILHEYFVPPNRLSEFLDRIRPMLRHPGGPDLLNVTIRKVRRDDLTDLAYAREDVFGLVCLFRYATTPAADEQMAALTRRLIDETLACRGTYYLPYRPHATVAQFRRAYPRFRDFLAVKRKYDPTETFENDFYDRYLRESSSDQPPQ